MVVWPRHQQHTDKHTRIGVPVGAQHKCMHTLLHRSLVRVPGTPGHRRMRGAGGPQGAQPVSRIARPPKPKGSDGDLREGGPVHGTFENCACNSSMAMKMLALRLRLDAGGNPGYGNATVPNRGTQAGGVLVCCAGLGQEMVGSRLSWVASI